MFSTISDLFNCLKSVENQQSKREIAKIIRREMERLMQDYGVTSNNLEPTRREMNLANSGKKIEAIKMYKGRTGLGLLESKQNIEAKMEYFPRPSV